MGLVLIIGAGFALFFGLAALIEGIVECVYNKKDTPKAIVIEKTPEQIYNKCCNCPHFKKCAKGFEEVVICKEYLQ